MTDIWCISYFSAAIFFYYKISLLCHTNKFICIFVIAHNSFNILKTCLKDIKSFIFEHQIYVFNMAS